MVVKCFNIWISKDNGIHQSRYEGHAKQQAQIHFQHFYQRKFHLQLNKRKKYFHNWEFFTFSDFRARCAYCDWYLTEWKMIEEDTHEKSVIGGMTKYQKVKKKWEIFSCCLRSIDYCLLLFRDWNQK